MNRRIKKKKRKQAEKRFWIEFISKSEYEKRALLYEILFGEKLIQADISIPIVKTAIDILINKLQRQFKITWK